MNIDKKENFISNMDVDIVYLWCDSSDENWKNLKNSELQKYGKKLDTDSTSDCRFINSDELKYSLRSLEKFAPWVNNIYIVTFNQVPKWLDTTNPKIHIISHSEILPEDCLPTFNACAIETAIFKIPNLSEHFLFANDDMFFGKPVDKSFFFTDDGKPIFRFSKRRIVNKIYKHLYGYMVSTAHRLVKDKFGNSCPYFPHHNIDAYCKSDMEACYKAFEEGFKLTAKQKFREKECIQRSIFGYYSIANSLAVSKLAGMFNKKNMDSLMCQVKESKLDMIEKYNPTLFCLNDGLKTTNDDRLAMIDYLDKKYPVQSSFEKKIETDAQIMVCYHKKFQLIQNEVLTPIQVASELSELDLGIQKDNIGDNISAKNPYYCELTALYSLWKNSTSDITGLMHYRRLLDLSCGDIRWYNEFPENIETILNLTLVRIDSLLNNYDVILPMKRTIQQSSSVYNYYKQRHYISDYDMILEIIKEKSPEIYDTAIEVSMNSKELYLYNIFISKREFLDEYAKWLFDILGELEAKIQPNLSERDTFQQRVYGFLSERLFTIFVEYKKKQGLKFKEVPTIYCETNKKRYNVFQTRTKIYQILTKMGIRRPHWKEQYGV